MKLLKGAALILATLLYVKVSLDILSAKEFLIVAPMSMLFLVLAYLGADLKVKNFSFDADDKKLSINQSDEEDKGGKLDAKD